MWSPGSRLAKYPNLFVPPISSLHIKEKDLTNLGIYYLLCNLNLLVFSAAVMTKAQFLRKLLWLSNFLLGQLVVVKRIF